MKLLVVLLLLVLLVGLAQADINDSLKSLFDRSMERIAENIERGEELSKEQIEKMRSLIDKLKGFGIDLREILLVRGEELSGKAQEAWKKIMEKLGIPEADN